MSSLQQQIQLQDVDCDDTTGSQAAVTLIKSTNCSASTEPHHVVAMLLMHAVES